MNNPLENKLKDAAHKAHLTPGLRSVPDPGRKPWIRCLMQVLWPSFLGAAITVGFLFSLIDPVQIEWVHVHMNDSREGAYTAGFILFWIMYALVGTMIWILAATETPKGRPDRSAS